MGSQRKLDQIFPMKDSTSARLMILKADCLQAAGVISEAERQLVLARALAILDQSMRQAA